ncbi:glycine--tRNA ligase subunit beta [Hellea balneolensis]|uniref:glycine--tRNA ligase subunit beta n=1 Tax=Hellea balneolensis TaxID=287478 RepID=UPI0004052E60|nr:glycine--tRNA ligase subunit beta [Hellea balneolensis]
MAEFLFEIFCEEIPARMQVRAGADLSKALTDGLKKAGLTVENEHCYTGPRRLVFTADIPLRSPDISEERKGPRVGSPEQALAGFMRGAGLSDISEAQIRTDPKKGEYYVAVIEKSGEDSAAIIAGLIPDIMNNFPWPKSMKSGRSNFRWVRPLQSMICLLGGKTIEFEVGGITSGNTTEGHRRHGKGPFSIEHFDDYKKTLEGKGKVILSAETRKELIIEQARQACSAKGLELVEDEGLLNEVAGLAEWPVVILGDMDPSFLELPGEVIRLSMRTHQKYFAVRDPKTGELAPNFVVVANQDAPDGGVEIAKGNSKVLSARLADAQFFQSEDAKKKLIEYYDKLDTVVFHKKLGSIRDKAERVAALARELAPKVGADADAAEQAAKLAKCDLVTQTVVEFTSLQGQIGAQMYRRESGDADIATAIEQHYKPQGPSDAVPTNPVTVAVALADKLDTLVGFWAIDEKPTGSKDPFALRRAALGVVRIILENEKPIDLHEILGGHFMYPMKISSGSLADGGGYGFGGQIDFLIELGLIMSGGGYGGPENEKEGFFKSAIVPEYVDSLLTFILDRLKVYLRDKGVRHDIIESVLGSGEDDLVAIVNRVTALQSFLGTSEGENLLAGYKRAANILKAEAKKGDLPSGDIDTLSQTEALALQQSLSKAKPAIETALAEESYSTAMTALSELRGPIDAFFDNVMVVAEDKIERENNLRLLGLIRDTARQIADFDRING